MSQNNSYTFLLYITLVGTDIKKLFWDSNESVYILGKYRIHKSVYTNTNTDLFGGSTEWNNGIMKINVDEEMKLVLKSY